MILETVLDFHVTCSVSNRAAIEQSVCAKNVRVGICRV